MSVIYDSSVKKKSVMDLPLVEQAEYWEKKLIETYKKEKFYSEQLKVVRLMLHTAKEDELWITQ